MTRSQKASFAICTVSAITWIYFEDSRRLDAFLTIMVLNLVILYVFFSGQYEEDKAHTDEVIQQMQEKISELEKDIGRLKGLEDAFFTHSRD